MTSSRFNQVFDFNNAIVWVIPVSLDPL